MGLLVVKFKELEFCPGQISLHHLWDSRCGVLRLGDTFFLWAVLSSLILSLGKQCQWTDACLSQPCTNGSTCITVANQFSCICPEGFTGQKCDIDINECEVPGQCEHGGTCLNLPGSYQCQCPQGFTGEHCDSPYVPCTPSPCANGGTCRQTGDFTFECNCLPGMEPL